MKHGVQAVLFDLGDTVLQFGHIDRRAMFRRAARRTYRLWAQRNRRMPGFRRYYLHQWFAMHWGLVKLLIRRREMNATHYIRRACRKLWLNADDAFFDELIWTWYGPLADVATLEPGTHEMLEELSGRGLRLGIISNTFVPGFVLDRHLEELGLLKYFPHRVYSCDVGYRKPDRRIFQLALDQTATEANRTAFIGDLVDADVTGARRAGLLPIWKQSTVPVPHEPSVDTPRVSRLIELPRTIDQLNAVA